MGHQKTLKLFVILLIFTVSKALSQPIKSDTLTFTTETGLLVFKGYLNDKETNFAFDTGAGIGVLTKQQFSEIGIKAKGKMSIFDSNEKKANLIKGEIKNLKISNYSFSNVQTVYYDMPFLSCKNLFLLGADIINQLNWKFDFEKSIVIVSEKAFEPEDDMTAFPVEYKKNRHFTNLEINGNIVPSLIDFGFIKNFETSRSNLIFSKMEADKREKNQICYSKTYSMGLTSNSIGQTMASLFVDSISIGKVLFNTFQVDIKETTETKLGFNFFKTNSSVLIMNKGELKYWIKPSHQKPNTEFGYDAYCILTDGKLEIVEKTINQGSTANNLEVGAQIKSLNGKTADAFKDFCSFRNWQTEQRDKTSIIFEKMNGEKVIIKKTMIPIEQEK